MEAYIIETLRNSGVTDRELIHVNDSCIDQWKAAHDSFDFTLLQSLAEDEESFKSIIETGYTIKFLTLNGLVNLLRLKFSKLPEQDFDKNEQGVENLQMAREELTVLQGMLSPNWTIVSSADPNVISIKQAINM